MGDLAGAPPPVTKGDKIRCLKREVALRKNAYPRWVDIGRMKQAEADREIEVMLAILHDYEKPPEPQAQQS